MRATALDTQEAPNKFWAYQDARMKNLVNKSRYTYAEQTYAETMKNVLDLVYHHEGIYVSYGKKGISVKVNHARCTDATALDALEAAWEQKGIVKKVSDQGVIYRTKK